MPDPQSTADGHVQSLDWRRYVRQHLRLPKVTSEREIAIVDEVSQLLEEAYLEARKEGLPQAAAERRAQQHIQAWEELQRDLEQSESRHQRAVGTRLQDRLNDLGSSRGGGWQALASVVLDLRFAQRSLRKAPTFTLMVVLLLALGVGANIAILSVSRAVLMADLPYDDPGRLVAIWQDLENRDVRNYPSAPGDLVDYRQLGAFEQVAGMFSFDHSIIGDDQTASKLRVVQVTTNFAETLGFTAHRGRMFGDEDGAPRANQAVTTEQPLRAVLSYQLWRDRFGAREDLIGDIVRFGAGPAEIIGILPRDFKLLLNPSTGYGESVDALLPYRVNWDEAPRTSWFLATVARLAPGVSEAEAKTQLKGVEAQWWVDFPVNRNAGTRIRMVSLHDDLVESIRPALLTLSAAALLVLLVASINVSGIVLVRVARRLQELSIRSALGGERSRLLRLLLTESIVLALLASIVATLAAGFGLRFLLERVPDELPQLAPIAIDGSLALVTIMICLVCSALATLVPALRVTGTARLGLLFSRGALSANGGGKVLSGLVITQVALSLLLLVGAGLMSRSMASLLAADLGFDPQKTLTLETAIPGSRYDTPEKRRALHAELRREFESLPGVSAVSSIEELPLSGSAHQGPYGTERELADGDEGDLRQATWRRIATGYFETARTQFLEGRDFARADSERPPREDPVVIVDSVLARKSWPDSSAVGQKLFIKNQTPPIWAEVVGVVQQQRHERPFGDEQEAIYFPGLTNGTRMDWLLRTDAEPQQLANAVRKKALAIDPEITIDAVEPFSAIVSRSRAASSFLTTLIGLFSLLATILALCGLWGVIAQTVRKRHRELGLRLALGASRLRVLVDVLVRGLTLVAAGLVVGLILAVPTSRLIESQLIGVGRGDLTTYFGAAVLFLAIATLACLGPASLAARLDPAITLRQDE